MPVCDQKYIKIIGQKHIGHFAEFGKVKLFLEWLLLGRQLLTLVFAKLP